MGATCAGHPQSPTAAAVENVQGCRAAVAQSRDERAVDAFSEKCSADEKSETLIGDFGAKMKLNQADCTSGKRKNPTPIKVLQQSTGSTI